MRRLIVADHSLTGVGGHHFEYDSAIAAAATERSIEIRVLSHQSFDDTPAEFQVDPWFASGAYTYGEAPILRRALYGLVSALPPAAARTLHQGASLLWARVRRRRAPDPHTGLGAKLHEAIGQFGLTAADDLLFHTLGPDDLDDLVTALTAGEAAPEQLPFLHLLLRRTPAEMDRGRAADRSVATVLARVAASPALARRVAFHADTLHLARAFGALSPFQFGVVPIVFRHDLLDAALAAASPGRGPPTIAYLGDARLEKGFQYLPRIVAELAAALGPGGTRFLFQAVPNIPGGEPGIVQAIAALRTRFGAETVRLIETPLQPQDYYAALAAADIVLLPYRAEAYTLRSSGIQIQAMIAGKPVVVPRGTWMEDALAEGAGLAFGDPREIAGCIAAIVGDLERFRSEATEAAPALRRAQAPGRLIDALEAARQRAEAGQTGG